MSEQKIERALAECRGMVSQIASPVTMEGLEYQGFNFYTGEFLYRCSSCGAYVAVNPMIVSHPQRHNNDAHHADGVTRETRRSTANFIWWVSAWWILYFILVFFSVPILTIMLS